jgi:hypothetical protein
LLRRLRWVDGLVDPRGLAQHGRLGWLADEPVWVRHEGVIQDGRSGGDDLAGRAVVDVGRGEQCDPAVAVLVVVPAEKPLAEGAGVLDRAEPVWEAGMVFESLELAFRVGLSSGTWGRE